MGWLFPRRLPGETRPKPPPPKPRPKPKPKAADAVVYAVHPPLAWVVDYVIVSGGCTAITFLGLYGALIAVP